ncbi:MAG: asparagine synthase (glutamine-hydrolyzing) [Fuerstiella sp.]|nr:asparagine synthase (glutamine-hydrolyzing) [Fuerstiella sp.]
MCGIAGILCTYEQQALKILPRMLRAQIHRGPDGEGEEYFVVQNRVLGLGHRRLSILDLSDAGRQPMSHPESGNFVTYNGEIYNYPQLRRQFEAGGVCFRSHCDTEVLLYAWERWGMNCFRELRGMYAFAIYDQQSQRLVLARDPLGMKPLYYAASNEAFGFASEVMALHAAGFGKKGVDRRAVAGLLAYGSVPGPLTMLQGVRLLEPGSTIEIDLRKPPQVSDHPVSQRFWNFPQQDSDLSPAEARRQTGTMLRDSVQAHLMSDVPVGVFLSAGMDSTAIAALASRTYPGKLNTFTVGLADQPELDENPTAAETARRFGTHHTNVVLTNEEICNLAEGWLAGIDQPSIDGLNTYIVSWAVRNQGIKVALSGLGGDEIFGGYHTFRAIPKYMPWLKISRLAPSYLRHWLVACLLSGFSEQQRAKAQEFVQARPSVMDLVLRRRRLLSDTEIKSLGLMTESLGLTCNVLLPQAELSDELKGMDPVSAVGVTEARHYMGNTLLRDADVCGMAHGLEIRMPMLDLDLVETTSRVPGPLRLGNRQMNKPLLADSLGGEVFGDIPKQPKRGFTMPCAAWMQGPLRDLFESRIDEVRNSGLVDADVVGNMWQEFQRSSQNTQWTRAWLMGVLGSFLIRLRA